MVDNDFHEKEKEFIKNVGKNLGIDSAVIENEIHSAMNVRPPLPEDETLRFKLLDDLINLMTADGKIQDEEVELCKKYAKEFGFQSEVVDTISEKIKNHLSEGYAANTIQILIKNELFKSTLNTYYNEK